MKHISISFIFHFLKAEEDLRSLTIELNLRKEKKRLEMERKKEVMLAKEKERIEKLVREEEEKKLKRDFKVRLYLYT